MTSDLINTVYLSEKRKQVLLMLMHKPATIETIKEALTGTTSAIMAQIKILFEEGLIEQNNENEYQLTFIGKIIMYKMAPAIKTLDVIEKHRKYWVSRDLSPVPDELLYRIDELGDVYVKEADLNHLFEPPAELIKSIKKSTNVRTIFSYFCPSCPNNYEFLAKKGVYYELILTESVYKRLKEEYIQQYDIMINAPSSNLYICDDRFLKLGSLSLTDDILILSFFNYLGIYDHQKLLCYEKSALDWGRYLFEYFKKHSKKVDKPV